MSYTYEENPCYDCEVCLVCDGTGGDCLHGECEECYGTGMIHVCTPWEYQAYMEQQTAPTMPEVPHDR